MQYFNRDPAHFPGGNHTMAQLENRPGKRTLLYCLLGILFGAGSYLSLALSSTVLLYPLILCFLFVKAGWMPVLFSVTTFGGLLTAMMNLPSMLLLALMQVVPAIVTIAVADRSAPYFTQLKASVFSFAGCSIALLLILGIMTKGSLVDAIITMMSDAMRAMPASMQDAVLSVAYPDLAENAGKSIPILGNLVRTEYWEAFFREMRESLLNEMLPMLIKSALTTAFLCSYLTARSLRLQDRIHATAFVPISQWSLPGQVTVGILLTTLAAYLYDTFAATGSVSTFMTMFTIMECVFAVQGMAAWDRMLCAGKAGFGRKAFSLGAMYVIAPTILSAIGICSALFGRRGLLIRIKKHNDNNN